MSIRMLRNICLYSKLSNTFNVATKALSTKSNEEKTTPWRQKFEEQEGEWYSGFKVFAPKKGMGPDIVRFLQSPFDFRPKTIRRWFERNKEHRMKLDQRFIPERHQILGNDLAAAHFIVHRGGSVKFVGQNEWIKRDEEGEYSLPNKYKAELFIEAIDASNMPLYYEGLANIVRLKELKWLSLNNCSHIDDWCLDCISGEFEYTLEYLDISNCQNVTERGLSVLYRLRKLQTLKVTNIPTSESFELTCLLLEEVIKNLNIEGVKYMQLEKEAN